MLPLILALVAGPASAANVTVTGVVRAQEEVVLRSEFAGIVQRIAVREGEHVQEGQLLVELRNERQMIAVDLSRAKLSKAKASVAETQVLLDSAQKDLARAKIADTALPRKDLEDRADKVSQLQAALAAQQAELSQAEEELHLSENDLKLTHLTAPFGGAITQIFVHRGDALRPTDTQVLELVAVDQLFVEVLLPVAYVRDVQVGQTVTVRAERGSRGAPPPLQGRVMHVNPKVDAASRTFQVKVEFANENERVKPGMLAEVDFPFAVR
jgi:macrolide-specific efflux system membrane fusion protein